MIGYSETCYSEQPVIVNIFRAQIWTRNPLIVNISTKFRRKYYQTTFLAGRFDQPFSSGRLAALPLLWTRMRRLCFHAGGPNGHPKLGICLFKNDNYPSPHCFNIALRRLQGDIANLRGDFNNGIILSQLVISVHPTVQLPYFPHTIAINWDRWEVSEHGI